MSENEKGVSGIEGVSLDDKYALSTGRAYMTGSQALVRLPLLQRQRDLLNGLNTAGFIAGYRGSPLGVYDLALGKAERHLRDHHVHFQPSVNEELAATSIWGSQQTNLIGNGKYDGVFSIWYGKGPGVDRAGDAIKHGNYAGSSEHGGVLVMCGDDPAARSSTIAHQSEHAMIHAGIPVLHPASVQEYLDFGQLGFALSRYSGCWVGFKCVADTVESSASVGVGLDRLDIKVPDDHPLPSDGLNIKIKLNPVLAESRLYQERHAAVHAFARTNQLDRAVFQFQRKSLAIITTGKTYLDVKEALRIIGVGESEAERLGLGLFKVGLVYPLEPTQIRQFASGYDRVLVLEEKRSIIEQQLMKLLFNLSADQRPQVLGKEDLEGNPLVSSVGELNPDALLRLVGDQLLSICDDADLKERVEQFTMPENATGQFGSGMGNLIRMPSFCAGCPHNTSTKKPDDAIAASGIGCHTMVVWLPERNTLPPTQMGGEGATWIGQSPFLEDEHMFQNIGDGTYFHSGLLAIRANVTAGTNITYKILVNGAIAMTGGQTIEGEDFRGEITAPHIAQQMAAEGVKYIVLVSDDPKRHDPQLFPSMVTFFHRSEMPRVQKKMQGLKGVSVILYEQACATERRRLRKRGEYPEPDKRLFINTDVCEGCGDCGVQSNCIALEPVETDWGRKRRINQSSCNKDFSCVNGLCPSFVTVYGGKLKELRSGDAVPDLSQLGRALDGPTLPLLGKVCNIMVLGIGGSGVITIGALLGMAAHLDGKMVSVLDMTGLAQRNGPVGSHIRICGAESDYATRIPMGGANLVIASDLVVAAGEDSINKLNAKTAVVYNDYVSPTSSFAANPDLSFNPSEMQQAIAGVVAEDKIYRFNATSVATKLLGNAAGANLFLLGFAWQHGLVPLSQASIERAIELNGVAVKMNLDAFAIGRLAAVNPREVTNCLERLSHESSTDLSDVALSSATFSDTEPSNFKDDEMLDSLISRRQQFLSDYQDQNYASRFRKLVDQVKAREFDVMGEAGVLTEAVARYYSKLLAYKDEYEVARLYSKPDFRKRLNETFEGDIKLSINLAPPTFAKRDKNTGRHEKREFGGWIFPVLGVLAKFRFLRGTAFDVFGYSEHRKLERQLMENYRQTIETLLPILNKKNHATLVEIARLPEEIRGFDVVKEQHYKNVQEKQEMLMAEMGAG
ncbi:MAG: indolepyruvate ferredoxin oxidoreductase family protein [Gammaproteobacteria bacterium]|nr:indolepyruvate ferredoxin oxidoreductase family protein [Gammaproteobacteria bacterium]